jgi:hypothetical protein
MSGIRVTKVWRSREKARIDALSNEALLDETLDAETGDDYDGCFTRQGEEQLSMLLEVLRERLRKCGFLPKKVAT